MIQYLINKNRSNSNLPLSVRIFSSMYGIWYKLIRIVSACLSGLWLGILKKETLNIVDRLYYENTEMYSSEKHNTKGLWNWEQRVLDKYFQNCKSLLVAGAGGGREVLALRKLQYEVDGFECNPFLLQYARELLIKEGMPPTIQVASRDQCPDSTKIYDGHIVGWGTYMLIHGKEKRVSFLKKMRTQTRSHSPILLSFFSRTGNERRFKIILTIGNVFRWILRTDSLEPGDDILFHIIKLAKDRRTYLPYFVHYFTREEIASELNEAGFRLEYFSTDEYGHAVGIASEHDPSQDNQEVLIM